MSSYPRLVNTVLDATDVRGLAEFYRRLLGLTYRPGDEPRREADDDAEWLVLLTAEGQRLLAFQQVETLHRTTWPSPEVPMQMHLCFYVEEPDDLDVQRQRAEALDVSFALRVQLSAISKLRSSLGASVSRNPRREGSMTVLPSRETTYSGRPSPFTLTCTVSTFPGDVTWVTGAAMAGKASTQAMMAARNWRIMVSVLLLILKHPGSLSGPARR